MENYFHKNKSLTFVSAKQKAAKNRGLERPT